MFRIKGANTLDAAYRVLNTPENRQEVAAFLLEDISTMIAKKAARRYDRAILYPDDKVSLDGATNALIEECHHHASENMYLCRIMLYPMKHNGRNCVLGEVTGRPEFHYWVSKQPFYSGLLYGDVLLEKTRSENSPYEKGVALCLNPVMDFGYISSEQIHTKIPSVDQRARTMAIDYIQMMLAKKGKSPYPVPEDEVTHLSALFREKLPDYHITNMWEIDERLRKRNGNS